MGAHDWHITIVCCNFFLHIIVIWAWGRTSLRVDCTLRVCLLKSLLYQAVNSVIFRVPLLNVQSRLLFSDGGIYEFAFDVLVRLNVHTLTCVAIGVFTIAWLLTTKDAFEAGIGDISSFVKWLQLLLTLSERRSQPHIVRFSLQNRCLCRWRVQRRQTLSLFLIFLVVWVFVEIWVFLIIFFTVCAMKLYFEHSSRRGGNSSWWLFKATFPFALCNSFRVSCWNSSLREWLVRLL